MYQDQEDHLYAMDTTATVTLMRSDADVVLLVLLDYAVL